MHNSQTCAVMFEGYNSQEIVNFDDVEPFEVSRLESARSIQYFSFFKEGYYAEEQTNYQQDVRSPAVTQRMPAASHYSSAYTNPAQQRHVQSHSASRHAPQQQHHNQYNQSHSASRHAPQQQHHNQYNQSHSASRHAPQQQYHNQYDQGYYY
jgi:hypothetical protein